MDRFDTDTRPLDVMCDLIVDRYHTPLHRRLPLIRIQLAELTTSNGNTPIEAIRVAFTDLADRIESHLSKEEHLLFPAIEALAAAKRLQRSRPSSPFATVLYPIRMLEAEHAQIERSLADLRDLMRAVPESGPEWHACLAELTDLDAQLHEHHRAENEVLFPGALEVESHLP